jgi:hypothetical protein
MRGNTPQFVTDLRPSAQQKPAVSKRLKKSWKQYGRYIVIAIVAITIIGLSYGYIHTRNQLKSLSSNPKENAQNESQKLEDKVSKLIVLPTDEKPTAATVNDVSKLKNQEFFSRAQNGDKVLVYAKSGRAVLYRPSINKVVEYSKVNLNQ